MVLEFESKNRSVWFREFDYSWRCKQRGTLMNKTEENLGHAKEVLQDPRWKSVVNRDPKADGTFFYSVKTTGIYCRPSCGARLALPENVQYHLTTEDAERAGFRACKRCKPNQAGIAAENADKIAKACRWIKQSEKIPTLGELATHVGMSLFIFTAHSSL
jgi:AraC family transcriptional regulator of adaptative response/methylated-DNA-[protein]-cysteine methyltransferase